MYPEGTRVRTRYGKGRVELGSLEGHVFVRLNNGDLATCLLDEVAPASWWRFVLWLLC